MNFKIDASLFRSFTVFGIKIVLSLLNYLIKLGQVSWRYDLNHFIVEGILLWLHLLDWSFEKLNFIQGHQRAFIVVVVLLFPKLSIVLALWANIEIIEIFIFLIVLIISILCIFVFLYINLIDSLFSVFLDQFNQGSKEVREDIEDEMRFFWMFHEGAKAENDSLSFMLLFIFGFIWQKLLHKLFSNFLLINKFKGKGGVNP